MARVHHLFTARLLSGLPMLAGCDESDPEPSAPPPPQIDEENRLAEILDAQPPAVQARYPYRNPA